MLDVSSGSWPIKPSSLSRSARFAYARLGGQPCRSRIAHVALAQEQYRPPNHDGVRSRSGPSRRRHPMLPGGSLAPRSVRQNETEVVRENERLERFASLRAPEYASDLRSD